ncbi:hypothetical protein ACVNF4_04250 [Streptomyces sp. S6]
MTRTRARARARTTVADVAIPSLDPDSAHGVTTEAGRTGSPRPHPEIVHCGYAVTASSAVASSAVPAKSRCAAGRPSPDGAASTS